MAKCLNIDKKFKLDYFRKYNTLIIAMLLDFLTTAIALGLNKGYETNILFNINPILWILNYIFIVIALSCLFKKHLLFKVIYVFLTIFLFIVSFNNIMVILS